MTLAPDRIGDKGQRYKVRAKGYPDHTIKNTMQGIAYTDSYERAVGMMNGIYAHPTIELADVYDRQLEMVRSSVGGVKFDDDEKPKSRSYYKS